MHFKWKRETATQSRQKQKSKIFDKTEFFSVYQLLEEFHAFFEIGWLALCRQQGCQPEIRL